MRKGDWRKIYGGYKTKLCHSALPDTSSSPPPMHSGPPQHPHSHPHHEPSRHIQRPNATVLANVTVTGLDIVNPRILDASIRDATERLSNEQKAEVLIHAMNLLRLANPFSHHIVENGVLSCLQAANPGIPQRVQLYLLRGRARMAAGDMSKAREDLHRVLELVPDHAVATSLLSIPSSSNVTSKDSRFWNIESSSRRLSPELWRKVASYLPRRDLKTLLQIPHVLSRIAFEIVFQRIDLHFGTCKLSGEEKYWREGDDDPERPGLRLEKQLTQRTADVLSRIVLDPSFAKLVKTVRISASRRDRSHHMAFQTTMLANALPKLLNLKEVIFTGSNEVWNRIAEILSSTHPRLQSLSVDPEHDTEPVLPHLTHLTQFKFVKDHGAHALAPFLAQNRATLRKLCLCTYYAPFPTAQNLGAVSLAHLTHIEFVGTVQSGSSDIVGLVLKNAQQLVSLRMVCVLLTNVAHHFREHANTNALPNLRNFGFRVVDHMSTSAADPGLFTAIGEFLRARPQLEKLELDVAGESNQARLGYDASILGVLPVMTTLRHLAVTMTKDASPGLFSWIIPRSLHALLLSGVPRRNADQFLKTLGPGLPQQLRYIALLDTEASDPLGLVEAALPSSIRLVHFGNKQYSVRRKGGHLEGLEEWPERRMELHAEEWLESLGCEDALWDDFAPGSYQT